MVTLLFQRKRWLFYFSVIKWLFHGNTTEKMTFHLLYGRITEYGRGSGGVPLLKNVMPVVSPYCQKVGHLS